MSERARVDDAVCWDAMRWWEGRGMRWAVADLIWVPGLRGSAGPGGGGYDGKSCQGEGGRGGELDSL